MPFGISIWELMILLVVLLLVFGAKRLPEMGKSLGKGMREFKDVVTGMDEAVSTQPPQATTPPPQAPPAELPSAPPVPASDPASQPDETQAEEAERETVR
jgi:sec-independent protein translocase protein TatA